MGIRNHFVGCLDSYAHSTTHEKARHEGGPDGLFRKAADFATFDALIAQAVDRVPLRIVGYTIMSNHWHFVVWPRQRANEQVSEFFRWLTVTHSQRWHAHHGTAGMGRVYQGWFKTFPIAANEHLLTVHI